MILVQNGMEICTADNLHVASADSVNFSIEENVEHAALIVRAVNSHAELLAAAKWATLLVDSEDAIGTQACFAALFAAIVNAEKTP
jgi:hypothetical protein